MVILILLLISGLIFSQIIIHDFKSQLISHDYEIAGYLLEGGVNPSDITSAITDKKSEQQISSGKVLLQSIGYKATINNSLLPKANLLLSRYRLIFSLLAILTGTLLLVIFFLYFKRQQRDIEKANSSINDFMGGNTSARLNSEEEGGLFKLFASVNVMATSLNAHIEKEKNTKEFLKDTISDISHQLKTPLTALKMYNEIIMQEENINEDTVKRFSVKIESALERMETLIQNLLKITKLDAGTITLCKKKVMIKVLVQAVIVDFNIRVEQEHKTITQKGSDDSILYCDKDWMTEAIGNLVKNAIDHTEANGRIEITWEESPAVTKIIIEDNGKGIHVEDIHHIFKRFYRSRFSQDKQGIGLGLSLTKSIVEAHNGTITVESTLNKGSSFILNFLKLTNM